MVLGACSRRDVSSQSAQSCFWRSQRHGSFGIWALGRLAGGIARLSRVTHAHVCHAADVRVLVWGRQPLLPGSGCVDIGLCVEVTLFDSCKVCVGEVPPPVIARLSASCVAGQAAHDGSCAL